MSLVITEDRGAVRHVILNRPEKRNAMNQALLRELGDALRAASADTSVHCVVLRGEGPVFSAGVDLNELMSSAGDASALRAPGVDHGHVEGTEGYRSAHGQVPGPEPDGQRDGDGGGHPQACADGGPPRVDTEQRAPVQPAGQIGRAHV